MSDWRCRIIANDHKNFSLEDLTPAFVADITQIQIKANRRWAPDMDGLIDQRIVECPTCGAPGLNTCWGYWAYECGAEMGSDGEILEICPTSIENA